MDLRAPISSRPTIAVVEDDRAVLNALAFALDTAGFSVRTFASARAVWFAADIDAAACLVVDQLLPDEPGLDLLARLRKRGVQAPAVIITTNPSLALRTKAAGLSVPIIEKPLLGDQLFATIRKLIAAAT